MSNFNNPMAFYPQQSQPQPPHSNMYAIPQMDQFHPNSSNFNINNPYNGASFQGNAHFQNQSNIPRRLDHSHHNMYPNGKFTIDHN